MDLGQQNPEVISQKGRENQRAITAGRNVREEWETEARGCSSVVQFLPSMLRAPQNGRQEALPHPSLGSFLCIVYVRDLDSGRRHSNTNNANRIDNF